MQKLLPIVMPFAAVGIVLAIGITIGLTFLALTDAAGANATLAFGTILTIVIMAVAVVLSMQDEKAENQSARRK
ncbi:MAG: hypothetical protein M9890_11725 [Thermomicrobiales bacterium]|nr:hypothetical protein [Thermomicrobiales bacterium]